MLKIDIDQYTHKTRFELQKILHSLPCPFFIRLSSSRTGLHVSVPLCHEWDFRRIAFDDQMRIDLDTQRELRGLPIKNLLWDIKNGLTAGRWRAIKDSKGVEYFLDSLATQPLYGRRAYYNLSERQKTSRGEQHEGLGI